MSISMAMHHASFVKITSVSLKKITLLFKGWANDSNDSTTAKLKMHNVT